MHEIAIPFIVVIGPTIFALVLEFVSDEIRKSIWWRVGVAAFGIGLSLLTLWQLTSERRAAANEREQAIKDTSTRVSADVTKAVTQQFKQTIADQSNQIAELKKQLAAQGKDVATIKGSNIVTGKNPVRVEVINPPGTPQQAPLEVEDARLQVEMEHSTYKDAPYAAKIVLQSNIVINPARFAIVFENPVKYVTWTHGKGEGGMTQGGVDILPEDSKIVRINLNSAPNPAVSPDAPMVIRVASASPLIIRQFLRGPKP
jgi:hypothetical protein